MGPRAARSSAASEQLELCLLIAFAQITEATYVDTPLMASLPGMINLVIQRGDGRKVIVDQPYDGVTVPDRR